MPTFFFFSKTEISIMNLIRLNSFCFFLALCLLNKQIGSRVKHKKPDPNRIKLKVTVVILYSVTQRRNYEAISDSFSFFFLYINFY